MNSFVIKADIVYSKSRRELFTSEDSYLVVTDGKCNGIYSDREAIPSQYSGYSLIDYSGMLLMPGMNDLHIHAPQFSFRGNGMDLELIPWLNTYAFVEEAKFEDKEYALRAYTIFADSMRKSVTTRAAIFGTVHVEATTLLMELMEKTGLVTYVGKINMDRLSYEKLQESTFLDSAFTTFGWINKTLGKFENTFPILTPRFIPSCSDELLNELHEIVLTYNIPLQSHLSENLGEIEWVKELCPYASFYGEAYEHFGLFGTDSKTIMAHCVYSTPEEMELMKKNGVYVAHSPASNMNLASGVAPVSRYLDEGLNVGLATDVAGGETVSMFSAMVSAIQASKLLWRLKDQSINPLTFPEAFYIATLGGGSFFGKVGSFEEGYDFDAVVIADKDNPFPYETDIASRLERSVYLNMDLISLKAKFVKGREIQL